MQECFGMREHLQYAVGASDLLVLLVGELCKLVCAIVVLDAYNIRALVSVYLTICSLF